MYICSGIWELKIEAEIVVFPPSMWSLVGLSLLDRESKILGPNKSPLGLTGPPKPIAPSASSNYSLNYVQLPSSPFPAYVRFSF